MTHLMTRLRDAARKRAAYHRTVSEIRALPIDTALDLDLYRGDAEAIARAHVYGR